MELRLPCHLARKILKLDSLLAFGTLGHEPTPVGAVNLPAIIESEVRRVVTPEGLVHFGAALEGTEGSA